VNTPARASPSFAGYFMLDCTDCLRTFRATSTHGNMTAEQTAVCVYCQACVPFLIESSEGFGFP